MWNAKKSILSKTYQARIQSNLNRRGSVKKNGGSRIKKANFGLIFGNFHVMFTNFLKKNGGFQPPEPPPPPPPWIRQCISYVIQGIVKIQGDTSDIYIMSHT